MLNLIFTLVSDESNREFVLDIYEKYSGLIRGTSAKLLKHIDNTDEVDDIESQVIILLIEKIDRLRSLSDSQRTLYIQKTAHNCALSYVLRNRHIVPSENMDEYISNEAESILSFIDASSFASSMRKLDDEDRILLEYKFFLELEDEEIAKAFGLKPSGVRMKLKRAKEKLRRIIEKEKRQ